MPRKRRIKFQNQVSITSNNWFFIFLHFLFHSFRSMIYKIYDRISIDASADERYMMFKCNRKYSILRQLKHYSFDAALYLVSQQKKTMQFQIECGKNVLLQKQQSTKGELKWKNEQVRRRAIVEMKMRFVIALNVHSQGYNQLSAQTKRQKKDTNEWLWLILAHDTIKRTNN